MRSILSGLIVLVASAIAPAQVMHVLYEGTWVTTNRPLDGTMTCAVTYLGNNNWIGHFDGVWQGVQFDYKVEFTGPPEKLQGKAVVDGARYEWTGVIDRKTGVFTGSYTGDRYVGSFKMKEKGR